MFDPYGMYGYDPRFAPNPGLQRPNPRPGYTDQPQGQNGQQAGPGWVFVPRVDDIVNVTVQPGGKAWIMAQDQPVFAVRTITDSKNTAPQRQKRPRARNMSPGRSLPVWRRL